MTSIVKQTEAIASRISSATSSTFALYYGCVRPNLRTTVYLEATRPISSRTLLWNSSSSSRCLSIDKCSSYLKRQGLLVPSRQLSECFHFHQFSTSAPLEDRNKQETLGAESDGPAAAGEEENASSISRSPRHQRCTEKSTSNGFSGEGTSQLEVEATTAHQGVEGGRQVATKQHEKADNSNRRSRKRQGSIVSKKKIRSKFERSQLRESVLKIFEGASGRKGKGERGKKNDSIETEASANIPKFDKIFALALYRRPAFPGFYQVLQVGDQDVLEFLGAIKERGNGYIGGFMSKVRDGIGFVSLSLRMRILGIERRGFFQVLTFAFPIDVC